jgi:hypothetical protein
LKTWSVPSRDRRRGYRPLKAFAPPRKRQLTRAGVRRPISDARRRAGSGHRGRHERQRAHRTGRRPAEALTSRTKPAMVTGPIVPTSGSTWAADRVSSTRFWLASDASVGSPMKAPGRHGLWVGIAHRCARGRADVRGHLGQSGGLRQRGPGNRGRPRGPTRGDRREDAKRRDDRDGRPPSSSFASASECHRNSVLDAPAFSSGRNGRCCRSAAIALDA